MPSPDRRSMCRYCRQPVEQTGSEPWVTGKTGGIGYERECPAAPNPDDGPMPGHVPGHIAERPTALSVLSASADHVPPPVSIPYIPQHQVPRHEHLS